MKTLTGGAYVLGTTPYAWPYDGDLTPAATAVLVVRPESGPWRSGAEAGAAREVAAAVRSAGGVVITVITTPPRRGEGGAAGFDALPESDLTVTAVGIDGFYGSSLEETLRRRGISRLLLVGFGAETCIHSTMRSANDRGFECLFVVDACAAYDDTLTPNTISQIEMSGGIFGAVGTADAVVAAFAHVD